jgi:diguanylate cyclase (GGDEF)-like protein
LLEVRLGEPVASAHSVQKAREVMAADGCEIAVVITDYKMPGETGIELLAHLAQEYPDVVTVLTTAYAELDVAIEAINQGHVYALLRKPASNEEILVTVKQALERHLLVHTLRSKIDELERANADLQQAYEELASSQVEVERLNEMAYIDAKTGVRSYRFLSERLDEEVARAQRYSHPFTLILIDLDGFKPVNDRLGHTEGDIVLKAFADLMQSKIRGVDVLARFGGDEFAVLLPNTDAIGADRVCERLGKEVREASLGPAEPGEITISMGVASVPEHPVGNGKQLVELADGALYKAKGAGGDCSKVA